MNTTLVKAVAALIPAVMLFAGSAALFIRERRLSLLFQLLGAAGMVVVVLTHICEARHWFPAMHWGAEPSVGHYLDLNGAAAGIMLFPIGYLLYALRPRSG